MLNLNELQTGKFYWVRLATRPDIEPTIALVYGSPPSLELKVLDRRTWSPRFDDYLWLAEFDIDGVRDVYGPQRATCVDRI